MTAGPDGGLTIAKVSAALVAAQGELKNPPKDKTAGTGSYSYKYADLATILDLVRPVLAKHGLAITQDVSMVDGRLLIHTRLIHSSGESLDYGPLAGSVGAKWQDTGGSITYARRYALQAVLGLASEEDQDGANAAPPASAKKAEKADKPKPTASDDQVSQWNSAITEAPSRVVLKRIADQIAAHALDDAVREDLLSLWQHKWEALA